MAQPGPLELRCNICGAKVAQNDAAGHSASASHSSFKSKLEEDLNAVRKEPYKNDSSVILKWRLSV
jgi:hypothetical protein